MAAGVGAVTLLAACGQAAPASSPASVAASPAAKPPASMAVASDPSKPATPKLATLDQELALPASILDAAKKEGKFFWTSSINTQPAKVVMDAFKKRYPEIDAQYQEGSEETRTVRTLTEFKAGKNKLDVVQGIGGFLSEYKAANALTPLNALPAYANYDPPFRDPGNLWASMRTQYWSIVYNTDKVKAADLPKTWDDLTTATWKGRMGLGDRPQLWVLQLWKTWGAQRATDFLKKLFANNPQRRKEGIDASTKLAGAGEYDLYLPAAPYHAQGAKQAGAPVAWYTPEPLPVAFSDISILANSPSPNAAKVFVNWFLSREGQDVYCKADNAAPVHPALRLDRQYLGIFADSFIGKQWAVTSPDDEAAFMPDIRKLWQQLWIS
ncbi:MAG TPA: extracellular solute-binding protein [Chloroflexota bacterium]|jgi:ABC-type Fe3+ transport system substrate-binding protein